MEGTGGGYYKQPQESPNKTQQQQVNVPLMNDQQIQPQHPMQQQIQMQTVQQPMIQQPQQQIVVPTVVNDTYYHDDLMIQAILVCCCCCHCFGLIAIFYSYEANNFHRFGKNEEARNFNNEARKWIKYSLICGLITIGIPVLLMIIAGAG